MKGSLSKPEVTIKVIELVRKKPVLNDQSLKPLSHQTAMPQRLYSVLNTYTLVSTLWGRREIRLKYQICHLQRIHSVLTACLQRPHDVPVASTARKQLLQRVHGALTARTQCAYSVFTAIIAFKIFLLILLPYFANIVINFQFSKQFVIVFNSC